MLENVMIIFFCERREEDLKSQSWLNVTREANVSGAAAQLVINVFMLSACLCRCVQSNWRTIVDKFIPTFIRFYWQIVKCFIEYGIVDIKLAAGGNRWPVGCSSFSSLYFLFSLSLVLFA